MEVADFALKIGAAVLAGLLIGVEREFRNKQAGLKTNALVSLGAAVFVLTSMQFRGEPEVDITRVLGQVVTGIGFIGAGVILHKGATVKGLTTAATVWCSAAAGCLAATGQFWELLILTFLILFINVVFGAMDNLIDKKVSKDNDNEEET